MFLKKWKMIRVLARMIGTRLPPTEPTGEIGTTVRWWRDMSFLEMNEKRTVPLHGGEFLKKRKTSGASAGTPPTPPPAADARFGQNSCSSKLITAPSESSAISRSLGLKRHAK